MTRWSIAALLVLNLALLAWNLLGYWGADPDRRHDAQRVQQQIRPEALHILPADNPASHPDHKP